MSEVSRDRERTRGRLRHGIKLWNGKKEMYNQSDMSEDTKIRDERVK